MWEVRGGLSMERGERWEFMVELDTFFADVQWYR